MRCNSSLQRTHFYCSRVQWLHTTAVVCLAVCIVIVSLCAAAWARKPISWSSWCTVLVLMLLQRQFGTLLWVMQQMICNFYLLHISALSGPALWVSCGLPLRVLAAVAPRWFHFTIVTLTDDQGRSIQTESTQTDLGQRSNDFVHMILMYIYLYMYKFNIHIYIPADYHIPNCSIWYRSDN